MHLFDRPLGKLLRWVAAGAAALGLGAALALQPSSGGAAQPAYIRPGFAATMAELRPTILAAAARHNRSGDSGMSDREFASLIVLILYNEHDGWLEDSIPLLHAVTPAYQRAQVDINLATGSDLTVWPANLRPSVAEEIVAGQTPVSRGWIITPMALQSFPRRSGPSERERYIALTQTLSDTTSAIDYLAANLMRGVARARYEGVPISWRALAAWHNQGVVGPQQIAANATAQGYLSRAARYLPAARALFDEPDALSR